MIFVKNISDKIQSILDKQKITNKSITMPIDDVDLIYKLLEDLRIGTDEHILKMNKKVITVNKICEITKLSFSTIHAYLGNYRFTKYLGNNLPTKQSKIILCKEFMLELANYLILRKNEKEAKLIIDYWNKVAYKNKYKRNKN